MRVPTAADTPELERIVNQACRDARSKVENDYDNSGFATEAVKWTNLRFSELDTNPRVVVRRASTRAEGLRKFIRERLRAAGFDVDVETEW